MRGRAAAISIALVALAACLPGRASAQGFPARDAWATAAVRTVLAQGAFPGTTLATFDPDAPISGTDLASVVASVVPGAVPTSSRLALAPTMAQMHGAFVDALGLRPDATALQHALARAQLRPPATAGAEIVTRMLGLTYNHADDRQERFLSDPATRAETAWSAAQALFEGPSGVLFVRAKVVSLVTALDAAPTPPPPWVVRAVAFVGYPYVWGGEWETSRGPLYSQPHGGFDCSGLVWRAMVLRNGGVSARAIGGRTTYAMAAATPTRKRLSIGQLRPGDQIMFGDARGPRSPNNVISHTAISLGGDWFVQSSSQGVTIEQLTGSYRADFAFARRFSVAGYRRPLWRPPPPTPPPAQLTSAVEQIAGPGAAPVVAVSWSGPADPSLQTQLVAVPADNSAPITLAIAQPTSGSASLAVPPPLVAQPFELDLVTLRDGQELGRSSASIVPPSPPAAP